MDKTPQERWEELKAAGATLEGIDEIDKATRWQAVEPAWWLEMMAVARQLRAEKK